MTAGGRVAAAGKTLSIPAARPYFAAALALSVPRRLTGFFCDRQLRCKRHQKFQFRGTVHLKQSLATLCRSGAATVSDFVARSCAFRSAFSVFSAGQKRPSYAGNIEFC
jgi:hypothetical protein